MPQIYFRETEFYFKEPDARFHLLMKLYLCDPMPWRYSAWLLLNTRRQHYGQISSIHVLQRLRGIYTLAVTFALPSTKQRRIKFLTCHATLFLVRVRWRRNKLYNEGSLSFSLPLPNIQTHLSSWKKTVEIWFLFSCSFCCAGIKPQDFIYDNQVHHHWVEAWPRNTGVPK